MVQTWGLMGYGGKLSILFGRTLKADFPSRGSGCAGTGQEAGTEVEALCALMQKSQPVTLPLEASPAPGPDLSHTHTPHPAQNPLALTGSAPFTPFLAPPTPSTLCLPSETSDKCLFQKPRLLAEPPCSGNICMALFL